MEKNGQNIDGQYYTEAESKEWQRTYMCVGYRKRERKENRKNREKAIMKGRANADK